MHARSSDLCFAGDTHIMTRCSFPCKNSLCMMPPYSFRSSVSILEWRCGQDLRHVDDQRLDELHKTLSKGFAEVRDPGLSPSMGGGPSPKTFPCRVVVFQILPGSVADKCGSLRAAKSHEGSDGLIARSKAAREVELKSMAKEGLLVPSPVNRACAVGVAAPGLQSVASAFLSADFQAGLASRIIKQSS